MRHRRLFESVRRHMAPDTTLVNVVFMWRRAAWMPVWAAGTAAAAFVVGTLAGYGSVSTRIGLATCAGIFAALAGTEQFVLADTGASLHLLRGSRIRQVAVAWVAALPGGIRFDPVSSNLVVTEWQIGDDRYSVPRRFGAAMTAVADR